MIHGSSIDYLYLVRWGFCRACCTWWLSIDCQSLLYQFSVGVDGRFILPCQTCWTLVSGTCCIRLSVRVDGRYIRACLLLYYTGCIIRCIGVAGVSCCCVSALDVAAVTLQLCLLLMVASTGYRLVDTSNIN